MVSMGWLVDEFVVRWIVSMNWKIVTTMVYFSQFKWLRWSTFSGHPSGRWKYPHRTSHICHLLAPPVFFTAITICKSRLWHLNLFPEQSGACFVFRAKTFLNPVGAVSSHCVLRLQYSKKKLRCVHTTCLRCAPQALRGFAVTEDIHLSQDMSPSTRTNSMNRRDLLMRSGQATPIPLGGNVSEHWAIHCQHFLQYLSDQFSDTGNYESDNYASGTCQQEATTFSRRIVWPRKVWKICWEWSLRS